MGSLSNTLASASLARARVERNPQAQLGAALPPAAIDPSPAMTGIALGALGLLEPEKLSGVLADAEPSDAEVGGVEPIAAPRRLRGRAHVGPSGPDRGCCRAA